MSLGKFKNVFQSKGSGPTTTTDEDANVTSDLRSGQEGKSATTNPGQASSPVRQTSTSSGHRKLPPGTGPGTTGKPAPGSAAETDKERTRPAAVNGTATTHEISEVRRSDVPSTTSGRSGILEGAHDYGHTNYTSQDAKPSGLVQEDTNQLNPVTHERIRHLETEEVQRVKERERHIHHVQHHTQFIIASESLPEQSRELIHPVTNVREVHANRPEDNSLFEGQIRQYQDTLVHDEKERIIIDKGTVTKDEHTHHHVHHIVQPVIQKETIDRQRIRTTIPIYEVTHEAPVIHESQVHAAVPIERFLRDGGVLTGAVPQTDIKTRVLHSGKCTREVDGVADAIAKELQLGEEISPDQTTTTDRTHIYTEHDASHERSDLGGLHRTASERERAESGKPISIPTI